MDDDSTPCVSFIGIVDFTQKAHWLYCSESVYDLLGWLPSELIGQPSLDLLHPDEYAIVKQLHYDTITQDKAAVIAYMRMRHKDPFKGYVLCAISRTIVHNVSLGSVTFAVPGPKALQTASTASEITVITPSATNFEFRRWTDISPMPDTPPSEYHSTSPPPGTSSRPSSVDYAPPPPQTYQSLRTALILDRYTVKCTILYITNDNLLETTTAMGRSIWDFVSKTDEKIVQSWVDVIKGWGVNERGQPSDGGFGFGKFTLLPDGRDSSEIDEDSPSSRRRGPSNSRPGRTPSVQKASTNSRPRAGSSLVQISSAVRERAIPVDSILSAHSDGILMILRAARG